MTDLMEQENTLSLVRYSKLLKSYSAAFEAVKKECSFEKFKTAFPMMARDNPDFLEEKREELFNDFKEATFAEFLKVIKEQDIKVLLSGLDKIAAEAEITQDVDAVGSESASVKGSESASVKGSEKLAPSRVVAAHQYAVTLQEVDRLKEILSKEQEENNLLMEQIKSEMEELHNSVSEGYVLMNSVISH